MFFWSNLALNSRVYLSIFDKILIRREELVSCIFRVNKAAFYSNTHRKTEPDIISRYAPMPSYRSNVTLW